MIIFSLKYYKKVKIKEEMLPCHISFISQIVSCPFENSHLSLDQIILFSFLFGPRAASLHNRIISNPCAGLPLSLKCLLLSFPLYLPKSCLSLFSDFLLLFKSVSHLMFIFRITFYHSSISVFP